MALNSNTESLIACLLVVYVAIGIGTVLRLSGCREYDMTTVTLLELVSIFFAVPCWAFKALLKWFKLCLKHETGLKSRLHVMMKFFVLLPYLCERMSLRYLEEVKSH